MFILLLLCVSLISKYRPWNKRSWIRNCYFVSADDRKRKRKAHGLVFTTRIILSAPGITAFLAKADSCDFAFAGWRCIACILSYCTVLCDSGLALVV